MRCLLDICFDGVIENLRRLLAGNIVVIDRDDDSLSGLPLVGFKEIKDLNNVSTIHCGREPSSKYLTSKEMGLDHFLPLS